VTARNQRKKSEAREAEARSVEWSVILADAVAKPGVISEAYRRFWNYSVGNQLLALFECWSRGIEPGPIHTFVGWEEIGRHVKNGEKAITLCMPVTVRRKQQKRDEADDAAGKEKTETFTKFVFRPNWFVLSQTEGSPYQPADLPEWQEERALEWLKIRRVPFDHPDGNCQGYAKTRNVAVSPIAFAPHRTLFHELAHVVLGHTAELGQLDDHERTPRNLREVEAEGVALICCESLGLGSAEHSRGYIQHWLQGDSIPENSAHRIFRAADQILKAGRPGSKSSEPSE
jgi:antirestriction protein ArdC